MNTHVEAGRLRSHSLYIQGKQKWRFITEMLTNGGTSLVRLEEISTLLFAFEVPRYWNVFLFRITIG